MKQSQSTAKPSSPPTDPADPALQGEGNYTAARRHRKSVEDFVEAGKVEPAAQDAAPDDAKQARELQEAEEAGLARARK